MNKLLRFLYLSLAFFLYYGCENEENIDFKVYPLEINIEGKGGIAKMHIAAEGKWATDSTPNWFGIFPVSGYGSTEAEIVISPNQNTTSRSYKLRIYNTTDTATLIVNQKASRSYADGEVLIYEKNTPTTKASNLVFLGDGFVAEELWPRGAYYQAMQEGIEAFFNVEPYKSYREYFNIYIVVAESQEEGAGSQSETKNTAFGAKYTEGSGMEVNSEKVFNYALKIPDITAEILPKTTVVVIVNATKYGGTTIMYDDGKAIAIVPMNRAKRLPGGFANILVHEAGGHGFGGLADEYISGAAEKYPLKDLEGWFEKGFYSNISTIPDTAFIKWKEFFKLSGYEAVGVFEGGYYRPKGVWRPEKNSCMNDNSQYFNAPSRMAIVKRIMKNAGENFILEKFINKDIIKNPPTGRSPLHPIPYKSVEDFTPLGPPILIKTK